MNQEAGAASTKKAQLYRMVMEECLLPELKGRSLLEP